jgi:hypothetical protein
VQKGKRVHAYRNFRPLPKRVFLRYCVSSRRDFYAPAAVWENEGDLKFYSVTFARTYVDEANNYHDSDSFGRDDLPLADQAHTFIFERLAELKIKQSE